MESLVDKLGENVRDAPYVDHAIQRGRYSDNSIFRLRENILMDLVSQGD